MPAPVVVVHDEDETRVAILRALHEVGYDVAAFSDPMAALDAVEHDSLVRVLVTRMSFGAGKLNGLALYRMLEHKRAGKLRAVFIGRAAYQEDAEQDGVFLLRPADPDAVVAAVRRQMKPAGATALRMVPGPIIWQDTPPTIVLPAPVPITHVSRRTVQLLHDAHLAIERASAVRHWRMPVRRPFELRAG